MAACRFPPLTVIVWAIRDVQFQSGPGQTRSATRWLIDTTRTRYRRGHRAESGTLIRGGILRRPRIGSINHFSGESTRENRGPSGRAPPKIALSVSGSRGPRLWRRDARRCFVRLLAVGLATLGRRHRRPPDAVGREPAWNRVICTRGFGTRAASLAMSPAARTRRG